MPSTSIRASIIEAEKKFMESPWVTRLSAIHHSIQEFSSPAQPGYDFIITNPPYFSNSLKSPASRTNHARHGAGLPQFLIPGFSSRRVNLLKMLVSFCTVYQQKASLLLQGRHFTVLYVYIQRICLRILQKSISLLRYCDLIISFFLVLVKVIVVIVLRNYCCWHLSKILRDFNSFTGKTSALKSIFPIQRISEYLARLSTVCSSFALTKSLCPKQIDQ